MLTPEQMNKASTLIDILVELQILSTSQYFVGSHHSNLSEMAVRLLYAKREIGVQNKNKLGNYENGLFHCMIPMEPYTKGQH